MKVKLIFVTIIVSAIVVIIAKFLYKFSWLWVPFLAWYFVAMSGPAAFGFGLLIAFTQAGMDAWEPEPRRLP